MYTRPQGKILESRLKEDRNKIQVIMGPRQVGKSRLIKHVLKSLAKPFMYREADGISSANTQWIKENWDAARGMLLVEKLDEIILVFDEIQKIEGWDEAIKKEWDLDSFNDVNVKLVLLGSSRPLLELGLGTLEGRFERIILPHWTFGEMKECFDISLEQYIYFGGYPGGALFIEDEDRWREYIQSSIIDATISRDILQGINIYKPALLRQTLELAAAYSGKEISFNKMLGELNEAGSTTTIKGYLDLLNKTGTVGYLNKYTSDQARRENTAPKMQVHNNALRSLYCGYDFKHAVREPKLWGRIYESAIGAHIMNLSGQTDSLYGARYNVYYWREGDKEVDFVISKNNSLIALETKSNRDTTNSGLKEFNKFNPLLSLVIGREGFPPENFLSIDPISLFEVKK